MPRKSPLRARNPISPQSCTAHASPQSKRSTEMEPRSETDMLWDGLRQNLLAGTGLAFWLAGGMLRAGFPGTVDLGALTVGLAEIPLLLGACLLAARVFREAQP